MLFDQLRDDPHSEAGSSICLRGEERLEDAVTRDIVHTATVVDKCCANAGGGVIAPIPRETQADDEPSALCHGVDGVGNEIGEYLLDFARHTTDLKRFRRTQIHFDPGTLQAAPEEREN